MRRRPHLNTELKGEQQIDVLFAQKGRISRLEGQHQQIRGQPLQRRRPLDQQGQRVDQCRGLGCTAQYTDAGITEPFAAQRLEPRQHLHRPHGPGRGAACHDG